MGGMKVEGMLGVLGSGQKGYFTGRWGETPVVPIYAKTYTGNRKLDLIFNAPHRNSRFSSPATDVVFQHLPSVAP